MPEPTVAPNPETLAKVEQGLLAAANGGALPPDVVNKTLAESGLTVGHLNGIIARVSNAVVAKREAEAAERMRGIAAGTITDNGADAGKTLVSYKRYSEVHGHMHPKTSVTGQEPMVGVVERASKETEEFFEAFDATASSGRRGIRINGKNHRRRQNAATIVAADPGMAGLTIPDDISMTIVDNVIAELPWTMQENVFRKGTSEGIAGYVTALDLDPNTEAETIDGITFGIVGEGVSAPDFGKPNIVEVKGNAKTIAGQIQITRRMRKANPGIVNYFIGRLANAYTAILIRKQIRGAAPWPIGFLNQSLADFAPTLVNRQTAGTVTLKDLRNMRNEIPEPFREKTMWVTRQKTWDALLDDVDDVNNPKFKIAWQETVGPIGREVGKLGMPVTFSRHMPLLGATGDVCAINPGSLWTLLNDESLEIMTTDQVYIQSGGYLIVAFADATWGVMPGGYNKGVIALKTK